MSMPRLASEKIKAGISGSIATVILAALIVIGSRNLHHLDAALVGYTFATLFATFGITYRYAMRFPLRYDPLYWGAVFPIGMYTVCTIRLSQAVGAPFLMAIPSAFVYVALGAWMIVMIGLVREMFGIRRR